MTEPEARRALHVPGLGGQRFGDGVCSDEHVDLDAVGSARIGDIHGYPGQLVYRRSMTAHTERARMRLQQFPRQLINGDPLCICDSDSHLSFIYRVSAGESGDATW